MNEVYKVWIIRIVVGIILSALGVNTFNLSNNLDIQKQDTEFYQTNDRVVQDYVDFLKKELKECELRRGFEGE